MPDNVSKILHELETTDLSSENNTRKANDVLEILKKHKIIIYPAGVNGKLIQKTLLENGVKIEYFTDRAFDRLISINESPVLDTNKLREATNDYLVIIATNLQTQYEKFYQEVRKLNSKVQVIDGKDISRFLKSPGCIAKLNQNMPLDLIECENCGFERKHCPVATTYLKKKAKHKETLNDYRSFKFDWFGYIVSQTCTLKCKHCCEQIPYLADKGFTPVEEIVKDVRKIALSTKFLNFVELIGGEPLLHPKIEALLTELLEIENIGYIKSFTNATVVPSDELCQIMKNKRFMLQVSNYEKSATGKLLENIFKTREKLDVFGVKYIFTKDFEWLDFSSFDLHNSDKKKLKNVFKNCFLVNCHRVYKGKLYRCPHQYAGIQLKKLKELPIECIDIHTMNEIELAVELDKFEDLNYIDACRYCTLPFDAKPVSAGEQIL